MTLLSAGVESEVVWSKGLVKRSRGRRESLDTDMQGEDSMAGEGSREGEKGERGEWRLGDGEKEKNCIRPKNIDT